MIDYARSFRDRYSAALVADAAFRVGAEVQAPTAGVSVIDGEFPVAGPAVTVEANNDLVAVLEAVHVARPGDVVVITNSDHDVGMMGDLVGTEAVRKGLGGFVVDGSIRDRAELVRMGLPVACRGTFPVGPLKIPPEERGVGRVNVILDVGGATVAPGMWALADLDGAVFLASKDIEKVFTQAADSYEREEALAAEIRGGTSLAEAIELESFLRKRAEDPRAGLGDHLAAIGRAI